MKLLGIVKCDGYQRALASMVYKFFDKTLGSELHKPVIKSFKRRKIYARFKDNIWAADLAEMRAVSSNIPNVKYLLCVIDAFTKYAWVKPLKDEKSKTVLNAFIKIVNGSYQKPNKFWVDQGRWF